MKKVWIIAVIGLLVALLVAAGVFWMVDRSRFEDFMQEGIHEYHGYTRLDFEETVYRIDSSNCYETDISKVSEAGTFAISGIIQPLEDGGYGADSMDIFLGSMNLSQYPLPLESSRNTFSAGINGRMICIERLMNLEGNHYEGFTYWVIMSADNPKIYTISVFEDGEHIADVYPGETPEEALANSHTYWDWFNKKDSSKD